jgi:hypothetical protein
MRARHLDRVNLSLAHSHHGIARHPQFFRHC